MTVNICKCLASEKFMTYKYSLNKNTKKKENKVIGYIWNIKYSQFTNIKIIQ